MRACVCLCGLGGELFQRIASAPAQRFGEAQARFFFVQMLAGIAYVHSQAMAHRDLKLENALLMDDSPRPRLAICDFGCVPLPRGRACTAALLRYVAPVVDCALIRHATLALTCRYTKSTALHSAFHTGNVGTPSYLAPELLTLAQGQTYDGKAVDVWAAGVVLYVMLVGGYPFGDLANGRELVRRIATATYSLPVPVSPACADLLARIFVVDPKRRISVAAIASHAWCTAEPAPALPWAGHDPPGGLQSVEALTELLRAATTAPAVPAARDEEVSIPYTEEEHQRDIMNDNL